MKNRDKKILIFTLIGLTLFLISTSLTLALDTTVKNVGSHQIVIPPFVFNKIHYQADTTCPVRALNFPKLGLIVIGFQTEPVSFVLLGTKIDGNKFEPIQYIMGNDYFKKIETYDLSADRVGEIFFWSAGGAHHQDLDVYKIHDKKLIKIFEAGSACGLDELKDSHGRPSAIKIYFGKLDVPGWSYADCPSDRYSIWTWQKDKFVFDRKQSSVDERSAEE